MLRTKSLLGIAAGCLLAWGQHGDAADTRTGSAVDTVFSTSETDWVSPIRLAHATAEHGAKPRIQQVGCFGSSCGGLGGELDDPWTVSSLMGDDPVVDIGGWFQTGYHNKSNGVFNTYPNHFQLQQGWLYAEKAVDGSDGFDIGGRVDVIYGTDGANTQAFGNRPGKFDFNNSFNRGVYGWAIPQLYGEVAYGDWSIKAGHFYTLLGYEVVPATGNFFYSHAFTMNFSEAFTHTGAIATYSGFENVELYGGWTLGWDTGFDQFDAGNSFLGGFNVTPTDDISFTYITTFGNLGWIGKGYSHSVVIDFTLTDKLHYITQSDYITTDDSLVIGKDYDTIGWNNYLIYQATDRVGIGARGEWWKAQGVSYNQVTLGVNVKPCANFILRPELRYQWAPAAQGNNANNQIGIPNLGDGIFGIDGILTF